MKKLDEYSIDDLKLIYRALHSQLQTNSALLDSELLHDVQTTLQMRARIEGVDVSHHAHWADWLAAKPILRL